MLHCVILKAYLLLDNQRAIPKASTAQRIIFSALHKSNAYSLICGPIIFIYY